MASSPATALLTPRDLDILAALDRCPLTAQQILKLSVTFSRPFTDERRVRERMQVLRAAGRVRRWQYATAGQGAPCYYTLTPLGYQLLHGPDVTAPTKRYFSSVGIARQHHTRCLADFVVHTAVSAHRSGAVVTGFYRENTTRLTVGEESLLPDCAFQLHGPAGGAFSYFVEIDNRTERVESPKDADSWERKIRLYDRFQDLCPVRFRVLVVATRGTGRLHHILAAAARIIRNPHRGLVYGISLPEYLACEDAIHRPCFLDHRGGVTALLPPSPGSRAVSVPATAHSLAS